MKLHLLAGVALACLALAACGLSGCTGLPGTGGSRFDLDKFVNNPACAHDDEISGITGAGGIPASLQFKAARHCPAASPGDSSQIPK